MEPFLAADPCLQGDPFLLPDMSKAVTRIYSALLAGENIGIYGDFDADGICGTALLTQALSSLGAQVTPYIPHRLEEGYGLNPTALKNLHQQGISLVITVDCGITDIAEVDQAKRLGLDIIITDHHLPLFSLPPALAVINPKRVDSSYPFPHLAGVGVAFKLLQALFKALGRNQGLDDFLDLVALGTVADLMPLLGENRYLVKRGLEVLNHTQRLGIQQIVLSGGLQLGNLDSESISWILAPRLNAAGRIDHAITSYNLLMTDSFQEAHHLAKELEQRNSERQRLTSEVLSRAREQLLAEGVDSPLLMVGGADYPPGVVGLVASKLVDEFYRPVIILQLDQAIARGSARSIPEFDIVAALSECQDLLFRFGGHPAAAGFALSVEDLPRLRQCLLQRAASQLSDVDLRPALVAEAEIPLSALSPDILKLMSRLAPFGRGNPPPTFLSRRVKVVDCYSTGSNNEHLRLKFREGNITWQGVGFDLGSLIAEITPYLDIIYHLGVDQWGGEELLQIEVLDFAPASSQD